MSEDVSTLPEEIAAEVTLDALTRCWQHAPAERLEAALLAGPGAPASEGVGGSVGSALHAAAMTVLGGRTPVVTCLNSRSCLTYRDTVQ